MRSKKDLLKSIIFIFLFSYLPINFCATDISNCTALQNIRNNLLTDYNLMSNIDCSSINNFIPIGNSSNKFKGTLTGNSYTISNLKIVSTTFDGVGLFGYGENATVRDLNLIDFNVTSVYPKIGLLFGSLLNGNISNVHIRTSGAMAINFINGDFAEKFYGGLVGISISSKYNNITIQNTKIKNPIGSKMGGFIGSSDSDQITDCHVIGFPSNKSEMLVNGADDIGGFIGSCNTTTKVTKSGVISGKVNGSSYVGGFFGFLFVVSSQSFSELYCKEDLSVVASTDNCGGLVGYLNSPNSNSFVVNITNSYTRSNVSGPDTIGGMFGSVFFQFSTTKLNILSCYSSNYVIANTSNNIGYCIGLLGGSTTISSTLFYANNQTNPSLSLVGNFPSVSFVTGLNCATLYSQIIVNYDISTWDGNNLLIEYNHTFGVCNCCPTIIPSSTIPPSTIPPTTNPPTTIPTTTTPPSTTVNTTPSPSTLPPTTSSTTDTPTITPTTNVPSTATPSTFFPSSITPSTLIPSSLTPSSLPPSMIPSTLQPTLVPSCINYNVPNCQNCPFINLLNIENILVTCTQNNSEWVWIIKSNNSTNDLIIKNDLNISTKIFFNSNLIVQPNVGISISASNASIQVDGCIKIEGDLNVVVDFELKEEKNINLINYKCNNNTSVLPKKVNLIYNNTQNSCLKSKTVVTFNSVSAIVSPSCGRNVGLIVGLSVGIPLLLVLVAVVIIFVARWASNKDIEKYKNASIEMQKKKKKQKDKYVI